MAASTFTGAGWIPVGTHPDVLQKIQQSSFVERFGNKVPMATRTKLVPRSGGVVLGRVAKGDPFGESGDANDSVTMYVDKIGGVVRIDEEDVEDSLADVIDTKSVDAADSYARLLDNSAIAVTAAKGTHGWLYDSLYYVLTQNDTVTGYTANSNITKSATATYDNLSATLGKVEQGDFFDPADTVIGAHPAFAQTLRGIKGTDGRPIFNESTAGVAGGGQGGGLSLFGHPFNWSMGLKTSAAGTSAPIGNPLLVIGNRRYLQRGDRSELEVQFQGADEGAGFLTDQNLLKFRARKGVVYGAPGAFAIFELG
ncbi:phage major capsid protein [Amycolatopsis albispora]|uniref:Phage capsid-like C-terminal domain-containing protein n=1 Tax=Amycolatopsis albispora TaxID=1804986 RepID=A0A344LGY2_9PSEU|nr:phage major capsid protein [Amycolatopsis albispora]AXB47306.1 hypothetical protein A4R43_36675 [Amycolatopsis albispora]